MTTYIKYIYIYNVMTHAAYHYRLHSYMVGNCSAVIGTPLKPSRRCKEWLKEWMPRNGGAGLDTRSTCIQGRMLLACHMTGIIIAAALLLSVLLLFN